MSEHLEEKLGKIRLDVERIKEELRLARRKRDRKKMEIMTIRLESKLHAYRRIEYAIDTSNKIEQGIPLEEQHAQVRKATILRLLEAHIEALKERGIKTSGFERDIKKLKAGGLLESEYRELRRKLFLEMRSAIVTK